MNDKLNLEAEPFEFNPEFDETPELFDSEIFEQGWQEEAARRRRKPIRSLSRVSRLRRTGKIPRPPIRTVIPPKTQFSKLWSPKIAVVPPVIVRDGKLPSTPPPEGTPSGGGQATSPQPEDMPTAPESSEYVRWVQSSLNRILGLQLPLDGIMVPETRSAIRSFQEKQGLPVDGIVGPTTEKALIEASRGQTSEPSGTGDDQSSKTGEFWESSDIFAENWLPEEKEFSFSGFPQSVLNALRSGLEGVAIKLAIVFGYRDENQLTNLVFFVRHPERFGRELVKGEPGYKELSREWLNIRSQLVRPVLIRDKTLPTDTVPSQPKLLPVIGMEKTSKAFQDKVIRIANDLGTDPNYLMAVMSFESKFDPAARNPYSGATGLIQFMPETAKKHGTSTDALAHMSAEQQLDYVVAYFAPYKGKLKTLEDVYMAVLWPKAIGKGPSYVLFSSPTSAYNQNKALDINNDGYVTVSEATSFVRKRFRTTSDELDADLFEIMERPFADVSVIESSDSEHEFNLSIFPNSVLNALRNGLEMPALKLAIVFGYRDENQLTNLVFFVRHPERFGRDITKGEPGYSSLVREWISIRDSIVRPLLQSSQDTQRPSAGTAPSGGGGSVTTPDIVRVRGIEIERQIASQVANLLAAAEADGISLSGWGYRSYQKQVELRKEHCGTTSYDIYEKPSSQCVPPTARPGKSMHEQGLAIDFIYNGKLIKSPDNPGFQWLARNAPRFGLYNLPSEPWHWSVNGK